MLPHITKQSVFAAYHSVSTEPVRAGGNQFERVQRRVHALGPGLQRMILHATILSIAVAAAAFGAIAD